MHEMALPLRPTRTCIGRQGTGDIRVTAEARERRDQNRSAAAAPESEQVDVISLLAAPRALRCEGTKRGLA